MLEVKDLNVFYGKVQVLWNVSFRVETGTLVSIIGPNGAGKTTTLRAIAGLVKPARGSIKLDGKELAGLSPDKIASMGVAMVPEGRRLFPNLTVRENLLMGAYQKAAWEKREETLEHVYSLFPILKERTNQLAKTLSGGEAQMLAIGRALMSRPKILLFDEPSLGLAPKIVLKVFETIEKLKETNVTIVLVEQHVTHALRLADKAYLLENGRIVLEGNPDDLMRDDRIRRSYLGIV